MWHTVGRCFYRSVGFLALQATIGLCASVALELFTQVTAAPFLLKINVKKQCLAMLVKTEQKPGYAEVFIGAISAAFAQNPLLCVVQLLSKRLFLFYCLVTLSTFGFY